MATKTKRKAPLVNRREAADILGVSGPTIKRIIAAGGLEPVILPGLIRPLYRRADIEALVKGGP
jgi:hypothetical protein